MLASGKVTGQEVVAPAPPPTTLPAPTAVQTENATPAPASALAPATGTANPVAAPTTIARPPQRGDVRTKGDPLEGFNRAMYRLHTGLDRAIFRPVAFGYKAVVPKPVRSGIRNIFNNLLEPIVFLNDLLQLRPKRAVKTFARFLINSTAGIGGLLDLAKDDGLPRRANGFGNTLARYGVGPGPYIFLPFFGPSTLRDLAAGQADGFVLPLSIGNPFDRLEFQLPRGGVTGLDLRIESDAQLKALLDGAADPYATLRSVYLQNRAAEVADARGDAAAQPLLDDPLADPEPDPEPDGGPAAPPQAPSEPPAEATPASPDAPPPAPQAMGGECSIYVA
ncbi:MAG: ABC transporter [Sphingomonas sp.]|nr:ABC transporter [Sphingomonas sp.]